MLSCRSFHNGRERVHIMPETFFGWVVFILQKYGSFFLKGTGVTLAIAIISTVLGFGIGLLVAVLRSVQLPLTAGRMRRSLHTLLRWLLGAYIEVFRGTPMIVQAMVIYYGAPRLNIEMNAFVAGVLTVSINTGAYMAEVVRGGISSVDKGQAEAAHSIGMSHWQTMFSVVLPQAIRNIMPSIGNEFIINIKDSSVLNVISVSELYFSSKSAAGAYFRYFEVYFITACIYLVLTLSITRILRAVEKRMDGPRHYHIHGSQSHSRSILTEKKGGSTSV